MHELRNDQLPEHGGQWGLLCRNSADTFQHYDHYGQQFDDGRIQYRDQYGEWFSFFEQSGANAVRLVWYSNHPDPYTNAVYANFAALDSAISKCVQQNMIDAPDCGTNTDAFTTSNVANSLIQSDKKVSWLAWSWDHDNCPARQISSNGNFSSLTTYGNDLVYNPGYGMLQVSAPKSRFLVNGCAAGQ